MAADFNTLTVRPEMDREVVRSLASELRIQILHGIRNAGRMNVNEICAALGQPQSKIATNIKAAVGF